MSKEVRFTLNGRPVAVEPAPGESLLDALRERCDVTSIKDGCQPQGQCGCCLALIDGRPLVTCAFEAGRAEGREVLTLEGVAPREREIVSRALAAAGGVQCGFCIPGIALRAKHLLDRNPGPSREEIARAIDGHLCRCTGYTQIVEAVELMARAWRGGALPEPAGDGGVGKPLARYGALGQALGERPYVADLHREGLLHGALVLSAHARARVARIDTSKAAALPGVRAVITAADVPGERWYGLLYDDWPGFVAEGEEVRCVGDVLAAVAADDARTAREAATLVAVEYETLPPVLDPDAALRPRRAPGQPEAPEPPLALGHPPGRRGGRPLRERARRHRHLANPADRAPLPGARGRPRGAPAGRTPRPLQPGTGRLRRPAAGRALPRRAGRAGARGARAERRGLRGQGGHVGPGADGAPRARHRPTGEARPDPRGVRPDAPEAPPHPARLHGGLRRRGQAHRGGGAARRRLGCLRLGRRQGPRARGRARLRPVPGGRRGRGGARRLHEQPSLRGHARVRRPAGGLRHRGLPRPPGAEGRPRRLGDPQPQRGGSRRRGDHGPGAREVRGPPQDARWR